MLRIPVQQIFHINNALALRIKNICHTFLFAAIIFASINFCTSSIIFIHLSITEHSSSNVPVVTHSALPLLVASAEE
jgi:hypothetical protein